MDSTSQITADNHQRSGKKQRSLTIGLVCARLQAEFPDLTISKLRYLEDQKLVTPRRTTGGYRQYSPADVERLRTVLSLQRDEYMPLGVIRQQLANGGRAIKQVQAQSLQLSVQPVVGDAEQEFAGLESVFEATSATPELVAALVEYGLVLGEQRGGERRYNNVEQEIIRVSAQLAEYGAGARNLRFLRTAAERESGLVQQILGASLTSHNDERRQQALLHVEQLAELIGKLGSLLLVRELRRLVG